MKMKQLTYRIDQFFLGTDQAEKMVNKGISVKLVLPVMRWFEWTLVAVTMSLVWFLKINGLDDWEVFTVLWMGNMLISGSVFISSDRSGIDLTLTEALRRLIEAVLAYSKLTGYLLAAVAVGRLVIWDGPSCFLMFFRSILGSELKKGLTFIFIAALQMAIWTKVCILIYHNLIHITNYLLALAK